MPWLLRDPVFASETRTQLARTFRRVLLFTIAISNAGFLLVAWNQPELHSRLVVYVLAIDGPGLLLLAANQRGHTRLASMLLVGGLVLLITSMSLSAGGIRSPGVGLYLVFVLMAGLLLGHRGGVVTAIVCACLGLGLVGLEVTGTLPPPTVHYDAITLWLITGIYMGVVLGLLRLATGVVESSLQRAEGELAVRRQVEQRLELALQAGAIGVWNRAVESDDFEGSPRALEIFGLQGAPEGRVSYATWSGMVNPLDLPRAQASLEELRAGARQRHVDYRITRADGSERHIDAAGSSTVDERGAVTSIVGIVVDATERRNAEKERERLVLDLRERVKELGMLHQAARLLQHGRLFDRSVLEELVQLIPAAWTYTECCEARITYLDQEVRTPGFRESPWAQVESFVTAAGAGSVEVRYTAERPVAHEGPFATEERALLRSLVEMLAAYLDHHETQARRRDLEAHLRRAQKMDALGTLAGGIAHDFNNILTAIGFNVDFALADLPADSPGRDCLDDIRKAHVRATDLVKQILLFSRKEESERVVLSLGSVVKEALKLLRASLPSMVEIKAVYEPDVPLVSADPGQIHQVMMNLGTNAGHAMGEGGVLSVRVSREVVDHASAPPVELAAGTYVCIAVGDTGVGMRPEVLERVFEPFFTTKGLKGTGLGLSVVHGIVREHGGAVDVSSQVGVGTTFRLYVPAAEAAVEDAPPKDDSAPRGRGERILYVDDEPALVLGARRILERLGYTCVGLNDPNAALDVFRSDPGSFAAVITDGSMPGLTGLQLARALRSIRADVPIGLASASLEESADAVRDAGIALRIAKPPTMTELARAVRALIEPADRGRSG